MSDVKWTPAQSQAITARGANVLVNAAAGSGKTAVLTERIVRLLAPEDGSAPIPADRLLVVTFTRAAASEMRARIEKGLKDTLKEAYSSGNAARRRLISRQIKQLAAAKITTIDSFCQSVVKEYFHILGIDPSFAMTQGAEAVVIKDEVFSKLTEKLYAENNESFYLLVKSYCRNGSELALKDMVYKLYDFTRSIPYPERFIERAAREYECEKGLENTAWFEKIENDWRRMCGSVSALYKEAALLIPADEKWDKARALIERERAAAERICAADIRSGALLASECTFETLRMPPKEPPELTEKIKSARNTAKETIKKMCSLLPGSFDSVEEFMKTRLHSAVSALAEVTLRFSSELEEYKRINNIYEFSDIEQLAYRLFAENETVRRALKSRYDEILIDEYQDTNSLQDELFAMISNGANLFMVGDMKQSIYRFRSSDPLVFRQKADSYSAEEDAPERKIALSENFRSRSEVLGAVNDLFAAAMSIDVGELKYDGEQRLNCGNKGYKSTGFDYTAECIVIENNGADEEEAPDRAQAEAEYIAARINEMKRSGFLVRDKIRRKDESGAYVEEDGVRPVKNSDFVVLMSSHKADGSVYREVFTRCGIESFCENEGYFVRPEIKLMMSLLRIIENPGRDIPMLAVMRSVAGGFSDEEIARMRTGNRNRSFYDILFDIYSKYLAKKDGGGLSAAAEEFGKKTARFCEQLLEWRDMSRYMSAEQLVRAVCEQAGLYAFFGAVDGKEAQANLRLFFDRAQQYESAGFRGLFSFLRHMESLEANSEDLPGASVADSGDCVRIMTIHKSKGLEMPVVFLAGCGKRFNKKSAEGKLLIHKELGIALDFVSYEDGVEIASPVRETVAGAIKSELLSEEMRKLYVALTRAKEKLIVTACIGNKREELTKRAAKWEDTGIAGLAKEAANAAGFIDWLAPAAMESELWKYEYIPCGGKEAIKEEPAPQRVYTVFSAPENSAILDYKYPYAAERLKSKAAVSDFKGIEHEGVTLAAKPEFLAGDGEVTGAEFGTAVHKIMETLPKEYGTNREQINKHIISLTEKGNIRPELLRTLTADKIVKFYSSEIGRRITAAEKVYRESEFEIGVDAAALYGDSSLEGEETLLQGVIDCWFYEDGEIVLVDYKTDKVQDLEEIHQKYDIQVALYAEALEKITKKRVKEKFIYLFSRDIVIQC